MKPVVLVLTVVLLLGTFSLQAQQSPTGSTSALDSLIRLSQSQYTLDSLKLNAWSDSLKSWIGVVHRIDSLNLVSKIDSLQSLNLPALPYQQKLDSLLAKKDALFREVENKNQNQLRQTKGKLDTWPNNVTEKLGLKKIWHSQCTGS